MVAVAAEGDQAALMAALRDPLAVAVIEDLADRPFPGAELTAALGAASFWLSLSTGTAWALDTAAQLGEALAVRGLLGRAPRRDVELAVHEAVGNAVLHGGLEMGGSLLDGGPAFEHFSRRLADRLAERAYAARRVDIAVRRPADRLIVAVRDHGPGYDPATLPAQGPVLAGSRKVGRGLAIMRAVAATVQVIDGGRQVVLTFTA
jgi:anti-sigma regulatory factor (Ser/Thr protein kinase)